MVLSIVLRILAVLGIVILCVLALLLALILLVLILPICYSGSVEKKKDTEAFNLACSIIRKQRPELINEDRLKRVESIVSASKGEINEKEDEKIKEKNA